MTEILYFCVLVCQSTKTAFVKVINGVVLAFNHSSVPGHPFFTVYLLGSSGVQWFEGHFGSCVGFPGGLKVFPPLLLYFDFLHIKFLSTTLCTIMFNK